MVYSPNKVVACVKVDGKILREDKNVVTLPFGSEYSVFIKNLNAVRIKIKVSVDGTNATEGVWLVVEPNSDLELDRFIRAANVERGNRFKFIESTSDIEEHRGIKAEDGLIRVEYQVEKPKPIVREVIEEHHHRHHDDWPWYPPYYPRPYPRPWRYYECSIGGALKSSNSGPLRASMRPSASMAKKVVRPMSFNDHGITVPGSESNQKFRWTEWFETGPSEVIVLQLRGEVAGKKVTKAVTVATKLCCPTCGKTQKSTEKFCGKCGTALEII
jgi:hypothetical protein